MAESSTDQPVLPEWTNNRLIVGILVIVLSSIAAAVQGSVPWYTPVTMSCLFGLFLVLMVWWQGVTTLAKDLAVRLPRFVTRLWSAILTGAVVIGFSVVIAYPILVVWPLRLTTARLHTLGPLLFPFVLYIVSTYARLLPRPTNGVWQNELLYAGQDLCFGAFSLSAGFALLYIDAFRNVGGLQRIVEGALPQTALAFLLLLLSAFVARKTTRAAASKLTANRLGISSAILANAVIGVVAVEITLFQIRVDVLRTVFFMDAR